MRGPVKTEEIDNTIDGLVRGDRVVLISFGGQEWQKFNKKRKGVAKAHKGVASIGDREDRIRSLHGDGVEWLANHQGTMRETVALGPRREGEGAAEL